MIFALDFLGLGNPNWKVDATIKIFPPGFGFGVFGPKVFGDPMKKVKALLATNKPSMFRLQLIYNKNHAMPAVKYMREEIPRWNELALIYGKPVFISPCCEYITASRDEVHDTMSLATELAPNCGIVQSPGRMPNGRIAPTFPDWDIEEHGNRARTGSTFVSNDGENAYDQCDEMDANRGIESWIERHRIGGAKYCFLWGARFNLLEAHNTLPPMLRKAVPEPAYTKGVIRLSEIKPSIPVPNFSFTAPKKPYLLKTFGEDQQGEGDIRGNKPMFMVPARKNPLPYVDIVTSENQLVARFPLFRDTNPNRQTDRYYYTKLYAWQLADKAMVTDGSPYVWLKEGLKYTGPFHMAFRAPFFQVPR